MIKKLFSRHRAVLSQGEIVIFLVGSVFSLGLLFVAIIGENRHWNIYVIDFSKDLFTLFFSLTIFDSFKDVVLRRETDDEKNLLLTETTTRFEAVLEAKKHLAENGIRDAKISFNASDLKQIILDLKPGSCLYCHDGSIPNFNAIKQTIINKALEGVKFRFMTVAPFCINSTRRAQELEIDKDRYSSRCKEFDDDIKYIRNGIFRENQACVDHVEVRHFRSLLSIPFYLLEENGIPTKAWTGFYLRTGSSDSLYIQWEFKDPGTTGGAKRDQPDFHMINELKRYWDFKWTVGFEEYRQSKQWEGEWTYECYENNDPSAIVYRGQCKINENSGQLNAICTRSETCKGGPDSCRITNIRWESDIIHKYQDGGTSQLILAMTHLPETGDMAQSGIKNFTTLKAINPDRLEGEYYIASSGGPLSSSAMFPSTNGTIILQRINSTPPD